MASVKPTHYKYTELIQDVERGQIKIPQFQRNFVWDLKGSAKLLDSILKNYPVGAFIFWRTKDRLRSIKNIGQLELPKPKEGEFVNYVLDGQQRITSLFAALKGVKIKREGKYETDYSKIYVDLNKNEDEQAVTSDIKNLPEKTYISIKDLSNDFDFDLLNAYSKEMRDKIIKYRRALSAYTFSVIELKDAEIEVATDIFTRINVGGRSLTLFEIMIAKTHDQGKFDLAEKFETLCKDLSDSKYDTIPAVTVLQTLSVLHKRDCTKKEILRIPKNEFIDMWEPTVKAVKSAVDYFRSCYRIPVSRLLPYNALIVPFAYYFYKYEEPPAGEIQTKLQDFFWRASLGTRYSSAVESNLAADIRKIDQIVKNEPVEYNWPINTSDKFIKNNGEFRIGRSYIKAILSIFSSLKPLSFDDNSEIMIDNSWLQRSNSRNYHHFFPKSYLKKTETNPDNYSANHIINITIVDSRSNLKIKNKPPSEYIENYRQKNKNLSGCLKTHLIGDLEKFGISDNNYAKFFNERAALISKEMKKRVIPAKSDDHIEKLDEDTEPEDIDLE